jgi:hypothetical protein
MSHTETILRYRVVKLEDRGPEVRAALIERGIDPDQNWKLVWSFNELADAEKQMEREIEEGKEYGLDKYDTYKIIDNGETEYRQVQDWF